MGDNVRFKIGHARVETRDSKSLAFWGLPYKHACSERMPWNIRIQRSARKKPHDRNFSACNSGAGNGCANFMSAWDFFIPFAGQPPRP